MSVAKYFDEASGLWKLVNVRGDADTLDGKHAYELVTSVNGATGDVTLELTTSLADLGITASAEDINKLAGITSDVQTQLDNIQDQLSNKLNCDRGISLECKNIDELKTPGKYFCENDSIAKTITGECPTLLSGFSLIVMDSHQIALLPDNVIMTRFDDRTNWGPWTRMLTNILSDSDYGTSWPDNATKGTIFFKKV